MVRRGTWEEGVRVASPFVRLTWGVVSSQNTGKARYMVRASSTTMSALAWSLLQTTFTKSRSSSRRELRMRTPGSMVITAEEGQITHTLGNPRASRRPPHTFRVQHATLILVLCTNISHLSFSVVLNKFLGWSSLWRKRL